MSPIPFKFRLINSVGSALSKVGIKVVDLNVEKLLQKAVKRTKISDFGDEAFKEGLHELVKSIEASDMTVVNKIALKQTISFNLTRRLILENTRKKRPDIFQQPLNNPLIVLGFPRTGTTIIHRLLALDPNSRAYTMLELTYPFPWMNLDAMRPQMQKSYARMKSIMPDLDMKHEVGVDIPEECINVLGPTFSSWNYYIQAPVPEYMKWCFTTDQHRKYREYKDYLHLLQSMDPEKRPTLKSPPHTAGIKEIHEVIPNAMMVQMHRDPVEFVLSTNSILKTLHQREKPEQIKKMALDNLDFIEGMMIKNLEHRKEMGSHVFDVMYKDLMKDPVATIQSIYDHYNIPWPKGYDKLILDYLEVNKKNKYGKHKYTLEEFGLTKKMVLDRLKPYIEEFFSENLIEKEAI